MRTRSLSIGLALLAAVGLASTKAVRFAADAGLVGIEGGALVLVGGDYAGRWVGPGLRGQLARIGLGIEVPSCGIGIVAGTTLLEVGLYEGSFLPVGLKAYWDFDPHERWKRRTVFLSMAYHRNAFWSDFHPYGPYMELSAGAAYTFYAVTPKAELILRPGHDGWQPTVRLLAGFELGGTYVFGR
jgi:hypothetical protein